MLYSFLPRRVGRVERLILSQIYNVECLLSRYNQWMKLPADELARDCGAFFGSLPGTLNHIMVADIIWLQRFTEHSGQTSGTE